MLNIKHTNCRFGLVILAVVVSLLAACGGGDGTRTVDISGQLTYPARESLPDHAIAEVSLIQLPDTSFKTQDASRQPDGSAPVVSNRIVAKQSLHKVGSDSVEFDIKVSSALLPTEGRYALTARIESKNGRPYWQTRSPRIINPRKAQDNIKLELEPTPWNSAALPFVHMMCRDGFTFAVATVDGRAAVRVGRRGFELPAMRTAAGPRYATNQVWFAPRRVGGAAIGLEGSTHRQCESIANRLAPAATEVAKARIGRN